MKWKMLRLFLPLLVLGFLLPLVLPGPDGKPIMSLSDWVPDSSALGPVAVVVDRLRSKLPRIMSEGPEVIAEPEVLYKWRDERGVWHFTNDPALAPQGVTAQAMPAIGNAMPAPQIPDAQETASAESAIDLPVVPGLPQVSVGEMVENAKDIREMSEQHIKTLEQL